MSSCPEVTVIIPARNEERHIGRCLESLVAGTFPRDRYEILVMDNGSVDGTRAIAAAHADQVLLRKEGNISMLRNAAASAARGEVIAFLDADCIPAPDWLERGLASLRQGAAVTGAHYLLPEHPSWVEAAWFCHVPSGRAEVNFVPAGNLFIRRSDLEALGGFDEAMSAGEDKDLCRRAAGRGAIISDAGIQVVHEGNPKTTRQFYRRELWHGRGVWRALSNGSLDKVALATLAFAAGALAALAGAGAALAGAAWSGGLLLAGLGLMALTVAGTLCLRAGLLHGTRHALVLAWLYAVYFAGRTVALALDLTSIDSYHNLTRATPVSKA